VNSITPVPPTFPSLSRIDGQNWERVDFISDLHLQASEPDVALGFESFLQQTPAQALFILGDLFELWVGDDLLDHEEGAFARECVRSLRAASERLAIYLLPGNRDFLLGERFLKSAGIQAISDPCVLQSGTLQFALSHGDQLCTSDLSYQAFRQTVRSQAWQTEFLNRPLGERLQMAQKMREQSMEKQRAQRQRSAEEFYDLDPKACRDLLKELRCNTLIHGHTHRPRTHDLGEGLQRVVLSDWDTQSNPPRLEVLRLQDQRLERCAL
jgi:UDP-2,3-diacylglucosamine hydrolase